MRRPPADLLTIGMVPAEEFEVDYERRVLIVDGAEGDLQRTAMRLLELGYDIHYANDLAEAQLLSLEHRDAVGAVLLASSIPYGRVSDLLTRFGIPGSALIPMGEKPEPRDIAALHHHGVRWHLWDVPDEQAIRFVLASVLSEQDKMELRFYLRVPVKIAGQMAIGDIKTDIVLCDISVGGACIMGANLGVDGAIGQMRFSIGDVALDLPTRTVWTVDGSGDGVEVAGVSFSEVDPESGRAIDSLVDSIVDRQKISATEKG